MVLEKIKVFFQVFSKIAVCILLAAAIYISFFWGFEADVNVMVLWQILLVSAVCSLPIFMYPDQDEEPLSKKGMLIRQIIYFVFVNVSVLGLGALFGWYHPGNVGMVTFMEVLIIGVYVAVNLIVYISDKIVADRMNRELEEFKNSRN